MVNVINNTRKTKDENVKKFNELAFETSKESKVEEKKGRLTFDIFNEAIFEELCAYFAAEDEDNVMEYSSDFGTAYFIGDLSADKSVGPDGESGTNDDGLPCSLEQLIQLCDYIKVKSEGEVSPLTVNGKFYHSRCV